MLILQPAWSLRQYYDLHVQGDTLLLADIFESFRNKCLDIYELYPADFLSATRLVWQACLKKIEVELGLPRHQFATNGRKRHQKHVLYDTGLQKQTANV